ncbi:MAG: ABC transporter permease [Acidimicrobiales bacterium]|nr:ABC transporter permease [Acidimicrobiales bacterium]MCB1249310.1 ABC transporter permease [Acidimicrobiales bacterium]MCB1261208.1 ABC transporter permease [Acidimicrobiales bacterium]
MAAPTTDPPAPQPNAAPRRHPVRELLGARELIANLTGRELKVRYKRSALGFAWTLLNPLLMMAVFTALFSTLFSGQELSKGWYAIYFLTGYLPFAFFQASSTVATGSVVGNAGLVTKVYFPRAVLPLSVVTSQLVHFVMGLVVLLVVTPFLGFTWWWYLPTLLLAIVLLTCFTAGISMLLAALNTYFRDIAEFTTVAFLLWFYATPVIYPLATPPIPAPVVTVIKLNPMTMFVGLFRSALYDNAWPGWPTLLGATVSAVVTLVVGWKVFIRLSAQFAKEV